MEASANWPLAGPPGAGFGLSTPAKLCAKEIFSARKSRQRRAKTKGRLQIKPEIRRQSAGHGT
jgi:hypothetical protein